MSACKVPVGAGEEDLIFEYLNLLVSRPEVAQAWASAPGIMWPASATGRRWPRSMRVSWMRWCMAVSGLPVPVSSAALTRANRRTWRTAQPTIEYLQGWAVNGCIRGVPEYPPDAPRQDPRNHAARRPDERILEMGAYLQITPALRTKLGYGEVRGCYYGKLGRSDHRTVTSADGETFECEIDLFDAEKDVFPYPDAHFATVLCCELIEHLFEDPMHLMSEINRILKPGGHLVLTTPNIAALRGIAAILQGYHPGFFHAYIRPADGRAK